MKALWAKITVWVDKQGGLAHAAAGIYVSLVILYASVPAFQQLISQIYGDTPSWLHQAIAALVGVIAWYAKTQKPSMEIPK